MFKQIEHMQVSRIWWGSTMHAGLLSIVSGRSWKSEEVPGAYKKANVHALFQKGKKENAGNYKPVSLT